MAVNWDGFAPSTVVNPSRLAKVAYFAPHTVVDEATLAAADVRTRFPTQPQLTFEP